MDRHVIFSFAVALWPVWVGLIVTFVVAWIDTPKHAQHPFIVCPRCGRRASEDREGVYCAHCEIDISELFG